MPAPLRPINAINKPIPAGIAFFKQSGKDFAIRIEHDKRKSNYAKLHNFEFLEIWYWDFENVENILIDKLDEL